MPERLSPIVFILSVFSITLGTAVAFTGTYDIWSYQAWATTNLLYGLILISAGIVGSTFAFIHLYGLHVPNEEPRDKRSRNDRSGPYRGRLGESG